MSTEDITFLNKKQVRDRVSLSAAHIDRLEKAGNFPARVKLGPGRVAWVKSAVLNWMRDRIAASEVTA